MGPDRRFAVNINFGRSWFRNSWPFYRSKSITDDQKRDA